MERLRLRHWAELGMLLGALSCAAGSCAPRQAHDPPVLSLEVATERIRLYDPLYVKVTLTAPRQTDVRPRDAFTWDGGGIGFQVCEDTTPNQFRAVPSPYYAACYGSYFPPPMPAGSSYAQHETLFSRDNELLFPKPGSYLLRACFNLDSAQYHSLMSEPVRIVVAPISEKERELIDSFGMRALSGPVQFGAFGKESVPDTKSMQQLAASLDECALKATLRWTVELQKLSSGDYNASAELASIRRRQHPIVQELIDLRAARVFVHLQDWKGAAACLHRVPTNVRMRDSVISNVPPEKRAALLDELNKLSAPK